MKDINGNFDRGVVNALMPSMHLMPQWISRLFDDCGEEAEEDDAWPLILLKNEARSAVWLLSTALGVECRGIPGQACRLLERYLANQMRIYKNLALDNQESHRFMHQLTNRIILSIVSCIQLAAKMSSADFQMNASYIRACLIFRGLRLSVADINDSEFRVYSSLGFRVPLWSSVDAAEVLAVDTGMPQSMLQGVAIVVNVAEYRRPLLDAQVRWAANLSPRCSQLSARARGSLRTLHLVAGCVAAAARLLGFTPDPAPRLADLTRAPLCYVRCVSNCVLTIILGTDTRTAELRALRHRLRSQQQKKPRMRTLTAMETWYEYYKRV